MRILVIGTHPIAVQHSMHLYALWLARALRSSATVDEVSAPSVFFNRFTCNLEASKWLKYVDQYVLLSILLLFLQFRYDGLVCADHSNCPSLSLVARRKCSSMVHDTFAMRRAFGRVEHEPGAAISGRTLQSWIIWSLSRCRFLFSNPGPVTEELRQLGVTSRVVEIGCPFEAERFSRAEPVEALEAMPANATYVLSVGADDERKRRPELLRLWKYVEQRDQNVWLVLAGKITDRTLEPLARLALERVIVVDLPSDGQLATLYRGCEAVVIASKHEGFCIPILEATAFDRPVFTPTDIEMFEAVFGEGVQPILTFDAKGAERLLLLSKSHEMKTSKRRKSARRELLRRYSFGAFERKVNETVSITFAELRGDAP